MSIVIVGEFSMGDVISPRSRVVSTEDLKVCFDFLVYLFSFSVRLRMIGGGKEQIVFQEFSKFLGKGEGNLRTSIETTQ